MPRYIGKEPIRQNNNESYPGIWNENDQYLLDKSQVWPETFISSPFGIRFNHADNAYLNRTPSVAGNRKTWTWSGWIKRSRIDPNFDHAIFGTTSTSPYEIYGFNNNNIRLEGSSPSFNLITTQTFTDSSSWYHIVIVADTTKSTASERIKIYVNGVQIVTFGTAVYPSQNADLQINNNVGHTIGGYAALSRPISAYLANIHFIDGQALTPSAFAKTDPATGKWIPKVYTGTYGTNGFYLPIRSNTSTSSIGADVSGNGNNWTANNLSVTAGTGNDLLTESITSYGTDTGLGGEVRSNYCTLNPLSGLPASRTLSNGNLDIVTGTGSGSFGTTLGTIAVSTGKWYWEYTCISNTAYSDYVFGIAPPGYTQQPYQGDSYVYFGNTGNKGSQGSQSAYGATYTDGDIIGVAFNSDSGSITFYKNGVSQGVAFTGISGTYAPLVGDTGSYGITVSCNFGQRPFVYSAPSGFKCLCEANLPEPTITRSNQHFDVITYTGNGSTQSLTGLSFTPDLVWIKGRSGATDHAIYDAVRGVTIDLASNTTAAETTQSTGITSFTSSGFNIGSLAKVNTNAATYTAWCWNAGGVTVTNTQGTITSQVRANTTAGISIVSYTGNGITGSTVGHGLNKSPSFIIIKARNGTSDWPVYHSSFTSTSDTLWLDLSAKLGDYTNRFDVTGFTSNLFKTGSNNNDINLVSVSYVAYCFASVPGFSAFGSYTGNGSTDGPCIWTGFKPRWIMIKCSSTNNSYTFWDINDTQRSQYNSLSNTLCANLADNEDSANIGSQPIDILSNGFKIRTSGSSKNINNQTYIYAAFAESPQQFTRGR